MIRRLFPAFVLGVLFGRYAATHLWAGAYALRWILLIVAVAAVIAQLVSDHLDHLERKSSHDRAADK